MKRYFAANIKEAQQTGRLIVEINGIEIGLFLVKGKWYAWRNICPHMWAPVCKGQVCGTRIPSLVYEYEYGMEGQVLRCPWHGWEFDLTTGKHLVDTGVSLKGYPVEIEGDHIYILLPERNTVNKND